MEVNKIYNEDCEDTMNQMPDKFVDCIITSPPYNIIRKGMSDRGYDIYKDDKSNDDYINWTLGIFEKFDKVLNDNGSIIYNMSYGSENTILMNLVVADIIRKSKFTIADILCWKKGSAVPNNMSANKLTRIVEHIYIFCRKSEFDTFHCNKKVLSTRSTGQKNFENIMNFVTAKNNDGSNDLNKATFSTELVRKMASIYANPGSLIYDPFIGTGTTAVGCVIDGFKFIGSEISKEQCDFSNKRIVPYMDQPSLFNQK